MCLEEFFDVGKIFFVRESARYSFQCADEERKIAFIFFMKIIPVFLEKIPGDKPCFWIIAKHNQYSEPILLSDAFAQRKINYFFYHLFTFETANRRLDPFFFPGVVRFIINFQQSIEFRLTAVLSN